MFTGIVEQLGTVVDVRHAETYKSLQLAGAGLGEIPIGASISVNGVCLTAAEVADDLVTVHIIPETLDRSTLGSLHSGDPVNLERPMPATGRFDGHIVQGHVDGVGVITALRSDEAGTVMTITPPNELMAFIVEKGSITVDGVSLTVAALSELSFEVALIPHTLEVTTLGLRKHGDPVNLEVDVLAKYVERLLDARK